MFSLAVFKNSDSAKLLTGQLLSQICDKMMTLGLVWVIASEMSVKWIPWFLALGAVPHLMMAWSAGAWVSKFGTLKTVVVTDAIRGGIFILAWALWPQIPPEGRLVSLFVMTLAANFASSLFNPAILSLPGQIREQSLLQQVTAAIDSCFSVAAILGPVLAALLYPWLGLRGLFLLNGLSYFLAALCEVQIKVVATPSPTPENEAVGRIPPQSTLSILNSDTLIRFLLVAFLLINLVLSPLLAFMPLFAKQILGGKIGTLATLEVALGVGTVLGSLGLSVAKAALPAGKQAIVANGIIGAMYLAFSFNRNSLLACVFLGVLGLALSIVNISMLTLFQTRPRPQHVPTIMSLVNLISVGALPLSMALTGGLLESVNLQKLAVIFAAILILITTALASKKEFRTL